MERMVSFTYKDGKTGAAPIYAIESIDSTDEGTVIKTRFSTFSDIDETAAQLARRINRILAQGF